MNKQLWQMIKIECKKAVCNRMFLASCLVSLFFVIVAALYNLWIGHDGMSLGFVCFYYLFALLAALPYGWAY